MHHTLGNEGDIGVARSHFFPLLIEETQMKKFFVLIPCIAVVLFLSNVNFVEAADATEHCTCCFCAGEAPAFAAAAPAAQWRPLAARRAARQAAPAVPFQMSVRGLAPAPVAFTPGPITPYGAAMGDSNKVYQRSSVGGAPVINVPFFSIIRAPRAYEYYPAAAE